jgi:hypothetical protein
MHNLSTSYKFTKSPLAKDPFMASKFLAHLSRSAIFNLLRRLAPLPMNQHINARQTPLLLEVKLVSCVFVMLEPNKKEELALYFENAMRLAKKHDAMLIGNVGGLLQFCPEDITTKPTNSLEELAHALARLNPSTKVVYGIIECTVGTIGNDLRRSWGVFPIALATVVRHLIDSNLGIPSQL